MFISFHPRISRERWYDLILQWGGGGMRLRGCEQPAQGHDTCEWQEHTFQKRSLRSLLLCHIFAS